MGHVSPAIVPRRAAPKVRYNMTHTSSASGHSIYGSTTVIEETDTGIDLFGAIIVAEAIESIAMDDSSSFNSDTSFDTD